MNRRNARVKVQFYNNEKNDGLLEKVGPRREIRYLGLVVLLYPLIRVPNRKAKNNPGIARNDRNQPTNVTALV